jgi:hypothetical protein
MVLWKIGGGLRVTGRNADAKELEKSAGLQKKNLEQGRCRRGFKVDAAAGSIQTGTLTTSACVGWDVMNIENHAPSRKPFQTRAAPLERFDHYQDHREDHQ